MSEIKYTSGEKTPSLGSSQVGEHPHLVGEVVQGKETKPIVKHSYLLWIVIAVIGALLIDISIGTLIVPVVIGGNIRRRG